MCVCVCVSVCVSLCVCECVEGGGGGVYMRVCMQACGHIHMMINNESSVCVCGWVGVYMHVYATMWAYPHDDKQ